VLLATLMAAALVYTSLHAPFQPAVAGVASASVGATAVFPVTPLETNDAILAAQSAELGRNYVASETALAWRLQQQGQDLDSVRHLQQALALGTNAITANNLAWLLTISTNSAVRNGPAAVRWAEAACAETGYTNAMMLGTLAAACAEGHRFNDAVAAAQKAHDLSLAAGETVIAARYEALRERYKSGQTFR
jgi:predicted nucleic acid-binding protein